MKDSRHPARVLILRLSALGDVAMTAPVVRAYAQAYPDTTFIMASAPLPAPLFADMPNLWFEAVDVKSYNGVRGAFRLYKRLRGVRPDLLLDLHQVLRTCLQCVLFLLTGTPVHVVKKGRRQKRMLTRTRKKRLIPLPSMISRYEEVFVRAGFSPLHVDRAPLVRTKASGTTNVQKIVRTIGIAPFAMHEAKTWPIARTEELVWRLSLNGQYELFLFGGGKREAATLTEWAQRYARTRCVAGTCSFAEELALIGTLDLLVSMDSANMHFASFMGVPVLSIWGGTHPFVGFYGWRQDSRNAVQTDLACRPCSVFGHKPCRFATLPCLDAIAVDDVFQKIEHTVKP